MDWTARRDIHARVPGELALMTTWFSAATWSCSRSMALTAVSSSQAALVPLPGATEPEKRLHQLGHPRRAGLGVGELPARRVRVGHRLRLPDEREVAARGLSGETRSCATRLANASSSWLRRSSSAICSWRWWRPLSAEDPRHRGAHAEREQRPPTAPSGRRGVFGAQAPRSWNRRPRHLGVLVGKLAGERVELLGDGPVARPRGAAAPARPPPRDGC